ncbi:MAG: hypothetical protein DRI57_11725 [Deltaproteobacteria bacterium]|nr:MAG: hypothetical protein DRI57_11725 [Deltaproteobacteria bacterium]
MECKYSVRWDWVPGWADTLFRNGSDLARSRRYSDRLPDFYELTYIMNSQAGYGEMLSRNEI